MSETGKKWINERKEFYEEKGVPETVRYFNIRSDAEREIKKGNIFFERDDLEELGFSDEEIEDIKSFYYNGGYEMSNLINEDANFKHVNSLYKEQEEYKIP